MKSLYISQPGCSVSLKQEQLLVKRNKEILQIVQLPHLEQIFIFSASQVTTQAIHACLWRQIPLAKPPKRGIVYLSRMGRCYGRLTPIESKFRGLPRSQHNLSPEHRLTTVLWNHLHSLLKSPDSTPTKASSIPEAIVTPPSSQTCLKAMESVFNGASLNVSYRLKNIKNSAMTEGRSETIAYNPESNLKITSASIPSQPIP